MLHLNRYRRQSKQILSVVINCSHFYQYRYLVVLFLHTKTTPTTEWRRLDGSASVKAVSFSWWILATPRPRGLNATMSFYWRHNLTGLQRLWNTSKDTSCTRFDHAYYDSGTVASLIRIFVSASWLIIFHNYRVDCSKQYTFYRWSVRSKTVGRSLAEGCTQIKHAVPIT